MRVRRFKGKLSLANSYCPDDRDYDISFRNIEVILRDMNDGSKEAAFDFVHDNRVYNVQVSRGPDYWTGHFIRHYKEYNDPRNEDSRLIEGYGIEGFQASVEGDTLSLEAFWIEEGRRYPMTYQGRQTSDKKFMDD